MGDQPAILALRLAGPLQAWGRPSEANRRETASAPSKAGIVGLLAAARGIRRWEPIDDLVGLRLGVRIDQPGLLLRDYHTVSESVSHLPLLSVAVDAKGRQRRTSPKKFTGVTQRFYLQDAVFVVCVQGVSSLIGSLADAVARPAFPLALGRRSCVPTQPILLGPSATDRVWHGSSLLEVLCRVPWQGWTKDRVSSGDDVCRRVPAVVDADVAPEGYVETVNDVPTSFDQRNRTFGYRDVSHIWVDVPAAPDSKPAAVHGFAYLGGS
ncbi:MAG: type I-E CRISPR-associated protein Cas5/CasD [Bifidobacteriaceae bacterium]|jgi:CRISPR system Cascade subunit CasD|nr:type I-E CRISPR-associated protein Cas5/CasD [Bifidobacteriaceae bacterium]